MREDAWKGGQVSLVLAMEVAVEDEEVPTILGGVVDREGGVPWKKCALQMFLDVHLLGTPL